MGKGFAETKTCFKVEGGQYPNRFFSHRSLLSTDLSKAWKWISPISQLLST